VSAHEHSKNNVENKAKLLLRVLDKQVESAHDYTNRGALCSIFSWPETTPDEFAQLTIPAAGQRKIAPNWIQRSSFFFLSKPDNLRVTIVIDIYRALGMEPSGLMVLR
jgi:hypothetical protein